jgi:hypothetical protein
MKKLIATVALTALAGTVLASNAPLFGQCEGLKHLSSGSAQFNVAPFCQSDTGSYSSSIDSSNHQVNLTGALANGCTGTVTVKITSCNNDNGQLTGTLSLNGHTPAALQNSSIVTLKSGDSYHGSLEVKTTDWTSATLGMSLDF